MCKITYPFWTAVGLSVLAVILSTAGLETENIAAWLQVCTLGVAASGIALSAWFGDAVDQKDLEATSPEVQADQASRSAEMLR